MFSCLYSFNAVLFFAMKRATGPLHHFFFGQLRPKLQRRLPGHPFFQAPPGVSSQPRRWTGSDSTGHGQSHFFCGSELLGVWEKKTPAELSDGMSLYMSTTREHFLHFLHEPWVSPVAYFACLNPCHWKSPNVSAAGSGALGGRAAALLTQFGMPRCQHPGRLQSCSFSDGFGMCDIRRSA